MSIRWYFVCLLLYFFLPIDTCACAYIMLLENKKNIKTRIWPTGLKPLLTHHLGISHFSLRHFPEPRVIRWCLRKAFLKGSNRALVSWCNTRERFQAGMPLLLFGLSPWKLSKRHVTPSCLLI